MVETKKEKFIRLAENRTNEAIKKIRLLGNLSNRNNYDYDNNQVNEIIDALEKEIQVLKKTYQHDSDKDSKTFKFKQRG